LKKGGEGGFSDENKLLTYFRKGKLQKFFLAAGKEPAELDFISAAKILEAGPDTLRQKPGNDYYDLLEMNKKAFEHATAEETPEQHARRGSRESAVQLLKVLKAVRDFRQFTDEQEFYLKSIMRQLEEGGIPKQTAKTALQEVSRELKCGINPLKILAVLQKNIPPEFLKEHVSESAAQTFGPREVILSEYLSGL